MKNSKKRPRRQVDEDEDETVQIKKEVFDVDENRALSMFVNNVGPRSGSADDKNIAREEPANKKR